MLYTHGRAYIEMSFMMAKQELGKTSALCVIITTSGSFHYKALRDNTDRQVVTMVIGLSLTANCWLLYGYEYWQILPSQGQILYETADEQSRKTNVSIRSPNRGLLVVKVF